MISAVPFATVLHGNQLIIGDGYADRDGISATAVGYDAVLTLHQEYGVPVALHLSGSVLEALAWHRPDLLARVRAALSSGLVKFIGGTYGENIMPLASPTHNRRQLLAMAQVMRELLDVDAAQVSTAWLPERVWQTQSVVSALCDPRLPGGGYRRVLVDDRTLVPLCLDDTRYRELFDATGPYSWPTGGWPQSCRGLVDPGVLRTCRVSGSTLELVPLCSHLRYLVPPFDPSHARLVEDLARDLQPYADLSSPPLLVFGDDLERVAGVAGWEPALRRYETFLKALVASTVLDPVHLDDWCESHPATHDIDPDPSTYYELAHTHGAGEDYSAWARDPRWLPYAERLQRVDAAAQAALDARPASPLVQVADRLALLGHHETAWQDSDPAAHGTAPAPWARATAAHAAQALPLLLADQWFAAPERHMQALLQDIDDDGYDELVLASRRLFAVMRPQWGGRLTTLIWRDDEGPPRIIVGNPADHWNFQEQLGRCMDQPAGHPGALGIVGSEHTRFEVTRLEVTGGALIAVLDEAGEPGAPTELRLTVRVAEDSAVLSACWVRPGTPGELSVRSAICPDYHEVLRNGRAHVRLEHHPRFASTWLDSIPAPSREGSDTGARAWVGVRDDRVAVVDPPSYGEAGHALMVTVRTAGRRLDLAIGGGVVDDVTLDRHLGCVETETAAVTRQHPCAHATSLLLATGGDR